MFIHVQPGSPVGLAEQIAVAIRRAIASGELAPGERLPSARQLAQGVRVNMHTVLRAYRELSDDGLVEVRRGRGARVRSDVAAASVGVGQLVRELVAEADRRGVARESLVDEVRRAAGLEGAGGQPHSAHDRFVSRMSSSTPTTFGEPTQGVASGDNAGAQPAGTRKVAR